MSSIKEYIEEWNKLGYTEEQSEKLAKLSVLGSAGDIEAHIADRTLYKTLRKYDLKEGTVKYEDNGTNFK